MEKLALLCKRSIVERVMPFAEDEAEARKMMRALNKLRYELADRGFAPR
jgi:hypothetical protein